MTEERKQALLEALGTLRQRREELYTICTRSRDELDYLPEMERYDDYRDYLSDAVDSLDSAASQLGGLIEDLEYALTSNVTHLGTPERVRAEDEEHTVEEEPAERLSFFQKLILGFAGAKVIRDAERRHEKRVEERERRWHDSVFWQEAAGRDSAAYEEAEDEEEDW